MHDTGLWIWFIFFLIIAGLGGLLVAAAILDNVIWYLRNRSK